ncbi:tRNA (adenosine(37)-N6)-threonylcarbamoyltransferase complex transferase subunit TsaD [Candidatus Gottesmanbacteria bacterium RIFOXYB1_FULL_47_11]|uniref:tRNA N6-adenosine threonylcarbamoyltransferase n=1 Tax=Candidatus Gottesmanbacteria bacterium RIFOXYB1_FULL_47_11 TaxID=1798401 RepID=A0A1F6BDM2_9BACT|nr:MAG: tRNA (adenosine(37)-N6)-threonylcarbamoyltransferase complex transferase subunit TsaD [Candidatus Gottesmanbacteria bacterium RIFOXYB1_FULL_47_11]
MKILAIESSCDETACAVVDNGTKVISSVIASSAAMHEKYGGIVPEVAAREQLKVIIPTITEATKNVEYDAIAVTIGPGLIGSLLVGVETAKTMAMVSGKPIIPVNHVLAHMYANFINNNIIFPAISLVVSGGHTELFLMSSPKDLKWLGGTLDDAAGEAFDKTARLLGFGSRGGVAIQEASMRQRVNASAVKLPRPLMYDKTLNFSFSGLKTAILRAWQKEENHSEEFIAGLAYEVQEAITDVLVSKTRAAARHYHANTIMLSGGVSANLRLREKIPEAIAPPIPLCTDNAVYIASYAFFRGTPIDWHTVTAIPDLSVEV